MTKRKYGIFTVVEAVPNWFAARPCIDPSTNEINAISDHGSTSSSHTSAPSQEGSSISAAAETSWAQAGWNDSPQPILEPVPEAVDGSSARLATVGLVDLRGRTTTDVALTDVALTTAKVASEEGGPLDEVDITSEDAAEWFRGLLAQSDYEGW